MARMMDNIYIFGRSCAGGRGRANLTLRHVFSYFALEAGGYSTSVSRWSGEARNVSILAEAAEARWQREVSFRNPKTALREKYVANALLKVTVQGITIFIIEEP